MANCKFQLKICKLPPPWNSFVGNYKVVKQKLSLCIILLCFAFTIQAQSWYTPGTNYVFESKSQSNPQQVVKLTLVYDNQGNATITKTTRNATGNDATRTCTFGPSGELSITSSQNEPDKIKYIYSTSNKYYLISFDTYTSQRMTASDGTVTVICTCKFGDGGSDPSLQGSPSTGYCIVCVPGAGCTGGCDMTVSNSIIVISGGTMIIKANSLSLL